MSAGPGFTTKVTKVTKKVVGVPQGAFVVFVRFVVEEALSGSPEHGVGAGEGVLNGGFERGGRSHVGFL